jgi:2-methylisocitrate lyase-like PEP mutase family enzyme
VNATDLPVSADLERGFGDAPDIVAGTIWLAANAGLVGCTIEDTSGNQDKPLYDFGLAVERIVAAETAYALGFPFILTARAHNLMYPNPNLEDTITRLQAFDRAGAESFSAPELAGAGVKRISLATSLYRAAITGFLEAASEVENSGQFRFLDRCVATPELVKMMRI